MYCRNCGKENAPGAAFCTACGNPLSYAANTADTAQAVQKLKKKNVIVIALSVLSIVLAAVLTLSLLGVFNGAGEAVFTLTSKSFEALEDAINTCSGNGDITASVIVREPLPKGSVNETGYYTDELGLLQDESELLPGLIYFYNETGVQPYVYLTGSINGSSDTPTMDDMQTFAESKYMELFTDDAHVLLVMFENDYCYRYWYTVGPKAKSVIDQEAGYILGSCIDTYYNDMSLSYGQFFSKVFSETADSIMNTAGAD